MAKAGSRGLGQLEPEPLFGRAGPMNDDRSPLLDLMTCIDCNRTMKLEKAEPDSNGNDLIHYRCEACQRLEIVRLTRRSWTV
jgi:hypothetical protein